MPDNRKSYNAVLHRLREKHGLTQAQARCAWRGLRDRLGKTPRTADLKSHPRITAQEARRAPARERAARAAKTRAARKAKAAPPPPRKAPPKAPPRRRRPEPPGGDGGGGVLRREREIPEEFEEIDQFYGGEEFAEEDEY